ncbi:MAG: extracellular solute-binding protein [Acetobacteraceae bacterium]|nr:extracellular solute-binding protein [Acetobacteraceae bacterium]
MTGSKITRRQALGAAAALGTLAIGRPTHAATAFTPAPALLDAARKEGKLLLYGASFTEVLTETIQSFNKRFPFIRVELTRLPGGQLFTRVQTEAASGKLLADVVEHSDRGLMQGIEDIFANYTPPNGSDYLPSALVSPKFWPTTTAGWCISYNTELVKNPPKNWMDLTKPEYGNGMIGQVIGPSGGTTWTRVMFERLVLGEDYWARQAATKPRLYPSGAPLSDSLIRGEVSIAPLVHNIASQKKRDGAPIENFFPPEGIPVIPYASGIPKTAKNVNAAKLFMDWLLSEEGQTHLIRDQGNLTSLKIWPIQPVGLDPAKHKMWIPEFKPFQELYKPWLEEWNKTYGYRQ